MCSRIGAVPRKEALVVQSTSFPIFGSSFSILRFLHSTKTQYSEPTLNVLSYRREMADGNSGREFISMFQQALETMQSYSFQQQCGYASTDAACRELRGNDKDRKYLYLELSGISDVDALIDAMAVNTTVRYADLHMHTSFGRKENATENTCRLFAATGVLPELQILKFRSRNHAAYKMPIRALTVSLTQPNQLTELVLWRIQLDGSPNDFQQLGRALRNCRSLRTCRFYDCQLEPQSRRTCTLDPVLSALSEIPELTKLDIISSNLSCLGTISSNSAALFGRFPSLKALALENFVLRDEHIVPLASAVVASTTLKELSVGMCELTSLGFRALAAMLHRGATRLATLSLHLEDAKDDGFIEVVNALPSNMHLEKFALKGKMSKSSETAVTEMIKTNHKLQSLNLADCDRTISRAIRFYVSLNNAGRGDLLGNANATKERWVDALHYVNDDIEGLYYFLIRNPSLCKTHG